VSQGKTVEGALKNVRKAITAYLKVARPEEVGALPEVLTSQVEVRV
jgi:predicted RNase H-like HicB family nuclease